MCFLPILKYESGYGALANMHNISYSCQSYCLAKELNVALLAWQIESSAIITVTAKVSHIASSIVADCSRAGPAKGLGFRV